MSRTATCLALVLSFATGDRLFAITLRASKPSFARTPAFCSHCGVSLDEPMEGPPR
jgi:hypothetical protein